MKLAAIFLVFKDQPFIPASFRAMYPIVDADEVHTRGMLGAAWTYVQKAQRAGYRMSSVTHFKSWNHCIEPNEL